METITLIFPLRFSKFESAALTIELRGHAKDRKTFVTNATHLSGRTPDRQELHKLPQSSRAARRKFAQPRIDYHRQASDPLSQRRQLRSFLLCLARKIWLLALN